MPRGDVKDPFFDDDGDDKKELSRYTAMKIQLFFRYFSFMKELLLDVKDDITSTFKPYKSSFYSWREWKQPFLGIAQTIGGVGWFILVPVISAIFLLTDIYYAKSVSNSLANVALTVGSIIPQYLAAAATALRGITQIVATPLILAKKVLRNIISFFSDTPKIETLNSTVKLVEEGEALIAKPEYDTQKMQNIISQLHAKYTLEHKRHVATDVPIYHEAREYIIASNAYQYNGPVTQAQSQYLGLFKKRHEPKEDVQPAMAEQAHEEQQDVPHERGMKTP